MSKDEANENDTASPGGAVVSMLDRPVADVVRFAGQVVTTWLTGLLDPWRLGRGAAAGGAGLAPPFAFLIVLLFTTGVSMRLWRAMEAVPLADDTSLLADLRVAVGEVSVSSAVLLTLPCVLIVAVGARLLSLAFGGRGRFDEDRVVAASCYAVGWQAGVLTWLHAAFVAMQMAGYEPAGSMNDEINLAAPWVALFVTVWGGLIVTPALRDRLPTGRWWPTPLSLVAAALVTATTFVGAFGTLTASADLTAAAKLRIKRQYDQWIGELQVNVLNARPLVEAEPEGAPRFELTLACTNRSERLLVVPAPREIETATPYAEKLGPATLRITPVAGEPAVSADLVIEPGATVVARFEVERVGAPARRSERLLDGWPYAMPYHRRDPDGQFFRGEGLLWAPLEMSTFRVAEASGGEVR